MRICIVCPHHISFQPRSLREADLFCGAGYDVRVVLRQQDASLVESDERLASSRAWRMQAVNLCRQKSKSNWLRSAVVSEVSAKAFEMGIRNPAMAGHGLVRGYGKLLALACSEPAEWFIAHTQLTLPIAMRAAEKWHGKVGFDCEDLLEAAEPENREMFRTIEQKYLPRCEYISVTSKAMGEYIQREYGLPSVVLYNVFENRLASGMKSPRERGVKNRPMRLHWFGQTVGQNRGIEDAIRAMKAVHGAVELHLRGSVSTAYKQVLLQEAARNGVSGRVYFHDRIDHDRLIQAMAGYDVGLALEQQDNANHDVTASNKLFSYMLAGLAIAATDTAGQTEVMRETPDAGFVCHAGDYLELARGIQKWADHPDVLLEAQQTAWNAARDRFCWDKEGQKLLAATGTRYEIGAVEQ